MVSLARYWCLSALAASAVLYHAFATRQHFYPTCIYLSTSKLAVAVVGNLAFATALVLHKALIKIFLGSLRDIEQEMVRERLSSAIMESLLALTIFREEFSGFFVAMFAGLVFVKVLHWLVQDRVDYIEVTPSVSRLQHIRIVSFMLVLLALDALFLQYTVSATIASGGQSVMLLFAFEYVIQASDVIRYFFKYVLSMLDLWLEGRWESKGTCVFYLDLITDLLHLFVYVVFFVIVFTNYGLPLHLVRDLYSTFRNFRNRVMDFLRFRQVSARLDRLPDASAEDLSRSDGVCIICREEMTAQGSNKKLFCGHVFHMHCLRSWLERQQNCPTCRGAVFQRRSDPATAAAAAAARAAGGEQAPDAAGAADANAAAGAPAAGDAAGAGAAGNAVPPAAGAPAAPAHGPHHAPAGIRVNQHHRVRLAQHHVIRAMADAAAAAAGVPAPNPLVQLAAQPVPPPGGNVNLPPALAGLPGLQAVLGQTDGANLDLAQLLGLRPPGLTLGIPGLAPMFPTLMPPLTPAPNPSSVIEQQAAAAAAAAALAAAAAVGAYNPLGGLFWAPTIRPPGEGVAGSSGSASAGPSTSEGSGSTEDTMARIARLTAELNTLLTEVNMAKQQALARQVAEQVQQAAAAVQQAANNQPGAAGGGAPASPVPAPAPAPAPTASQPAPTPASTSPAVVASPDPVGSTTPPAPHAAASSTAAQPAASTASAAAGDSEARSEDTAVQAASTSSTAAAAAPATAAGGDAGGEATSAAPVAEAAGSSTGSVTNDSDAQDEIRRKRLAKFSQQ